MQFLPSLKNWKIWKTYVSIDGWCVPKENVISVYNEPRNRYFITNNLMWVYKYYKAHNHRCLRSCKFALLTMNTEDCKIHLFDLIFLKSHRISKKAPGFIVQYNDLSVLYTVSWTRQKFIFTKILSHKELKPITTFNITEALNSWQLHTINFHNTLQHLTCSHMH